jgi:formate dehydrogenase subunit delta
MNIEHLVKMANQIGQFFEAEPDQTQAASDVAAHIKRFWNPRMRQAIIAHVGNGGEGLIPFMQQAINTHRQLLS